MKKSLLTFSIILATLFISCNNSYTPRTTVAVSIEEIKMEKSSIRAIETYKNNAIIYAGSIGDLGIISETKDIIALNPISYDTITPHFRAVSHNGESIFALSVGNPGLLYKYNGKDISLVYKEEHEKVFYDAMKFFDSENGIAMGDPTDACISIIITNDGGNTWKKIPCDQLPTAAEGEAAFAASNTNIKTLGSNVWIVTGGMKARVLHSSDMGKTWNNYETPIIQGKATTGIYSVDFYNKNQGIICGGDYTDKFGNSANKALTFDGGKTWEVVAEGKAPKYVSCVQYVPDTNGKEVFAVSTNGVFYSNDSGYTWEKVHDTGFYTIRVIDKNTAWLSANEVIAKMNIK